MPHRSLVAGATALCLALVATVTAPAAAAEAPPPTHRAPVDAPVADPFRPPTTPFGPGNRGLEYATAAGTEVHATADGVVVFAGLVAGSRHVTLRHDDGVRTSYSFLARIDVVLGQHVHQGDVVGITAGHLHLGARIGDSYFDPASLFGTGPPRVHLVPFDIPPSLEVHGERSALGQLVGAASGALGTVAHAVGDQLLSGTGASVDWLRRNGSQLVRTAVQYMEPYQLQLLRRGLDAALRAYAAATRECTDDDVVVAPPVERRVAITVAGLGSTSESGAIDDVDTAALGYTEPDVVRFSYAGGRTPSTGSAFEGIPASAYGAADTQIDLRAAGARLADLVEDVVAGAQGATIDIYAHSQGGVVTRLALIELERRHGSAWLDQVGLVATLGTPHGGADLATAVFAIGSTEAGSLLFDGAASALDLELDDDAESVGQLSETSSVTAELADEPYPPEVEAVSIAARGDLVVPVPRTVAPGAEQVVVAVDGTHAHDALPGSAPAQRELALALAGHPPGCQSFVSALTGQMVGAGISWSEDTAGALAWGATLALGGRPLGG